MVKPKPNSNAAWAAEHGLKGTEMTLNTDLTDLSDVTDEGLEAAIKMTGRTWHSADGVRRCLYGGEVWAEYCILLARCIQAHYPDMIVDPVTRKAREICAAESAIPSLYLRGDNDERLTMRCVKAAILAGIAMRKEG